ncbi:hypothetical protein L209DRAFT_783286 [Thermothelomyces heterothallicus CBS 203.75]
MHHFIPSHRGNGPFLLQLTDINESNIFVDDDDWNISCLLDLEWICALPAEMLTVPYWLTDCTIDEIVDGEYGCFDQERQGFLCAMEEEMKATQPAHDIPIVHTIQDLWSSKAVWFWACTTSINGWLSIFEDHILPKFGANKNVIPDLKQTAALWMENMDAVVKAKLEDEEKYRNLAQPGELTQPRSSYDQKGQP